MTIAAMECPGCGGHVSSLLKCEGCGEDFLAVALIAWIALSG